MKPIVKRVQAKQELKSATIREFSGGWNILDDDLNLSTNYSTRSYNCYRAADGTVAVRYGTKLFVNIAPFLPAAASVVNIEYYNTAILAVMSTGEIVAVQGDGSVTVIWNTYLASLQPGAPAGWSPTTFASFAQFNGEMVIANGVDKPLIVRNNFAVEYLHDEATGSNINTPIAKYVTVCNRYVCFLGDPVNPNRVHISARDTSGTFYGDPAPNDATFIDIGSVLANASIIRGAAPFRDKLIVAYIEGTVLGTLGTYDVDGNHTPNFDDAVEQYGSISHRTISSYGDDVLMMDQVGVPSLKRTVLSGTIKPERVSDLVDPEISSMLNPLSFTSLEDRTFSVYNQREGQFMFFIPNTDVPATTTETKAYVFNYRPSLKLANWSRFDGWNWTCACRSLQGSVFFGDADGKLWVYGSKDDPVYSDLAEEPTINGGAGNPINFDWELPWSDFNKRTTSKTTKYISMDTRGSARFTVMMYVDRYRINSSQEDAPLLSMEMLGGDINGFGNGDQAYGGGRDSSNEHLWAWPAKFKLMKLRFTGSTIAALRFASVSLHYQLGGLMR